MKKLINTIQSDAIVDCTSIKLSNLSNDGVLTFLLIVAFEFQHYLTIFRQIIILLLAILPLIWWDI